MLHRPPKSRRQNTTARSKDRRGYFGFPAGLAPAQRETPFHEDAGSEWSRRSGRGATGAWQTLKIFVKPCYGGPCSAHAIGMGTAGAPRGPTTPHTAILFLAAKTAGNRMAVWGSESPWRRSKLRRHGGFPRAAGNRRCTAGFPFPTAAVPPRSECPWEHRQPVGGAPAVVGPGGFYRQGQNDPLSVLPVPVQV
ncbi:hypothetical protein NDU88_006676 [Pleurodeles waltl]|uniref:Uncharacterized protein n=1 Tax=Pleurodeles waltl TaxID=8319 RepID=A0AAV7X4F9_PLEWA|nr:hypothetical protein NDU88_006676 [Pleurodeles waltl]